VPDGSGLRIIVDTNVLFEGLTKQGGAAGFVIDAWLDGSVHVFVSNALAYEYVDVLSRKLSESRRHQLKPVLGKLLELAVFVPIYFTWRPASADPGDEHLIDCAMNAGAFLITYNARHFQKARRLLGIRVMSPVELVTLLANP
jgi:predicted nucleic acid-binding protein